MKEHKKQLYILMCISFIFGLVALMFQGILVDQYIKEYWLIWVVYLTTGCLFLRVSFKRGAFLFEPIVLIGILFFLTYSVCPLLNIILNNADSRGYDVMNGCIYATFLYVLSFTFLLLGYYRKKKWKYTKINWNEPENQEFRCWNKRTMILGISYFWWIIGFLFFAMYFINSGFSLKFVLSLGMSGEADTSTAVSGTLDFLYNFRFGMIAAVIYLWRYGKLKKLYIAMYIITFIMFMSYGYRNILVEMIVAPVVFHIVLTRKPPKISAVVKIVIPIILMLALVETFRSSIRQGISVSAVDWSGFDGMTIYNAFQGNFDLYKSLYGIVEYIPKYHSFTWGQQLIWMTVTFLIPRSFWPGKPSSILDSLMVYIVGPLAVRGHTAMGTLAEYYGEFGIIGCLVFSFILGSASSYTKKWYEGTNRTEDTMIAYAILYPMYMLLAVRGYMPLNFMHILFLEIPVMSVAFIKHSKFFGK